MRPAQRVIVYVDGFNLYFGLRSKGWKRYYWLDITALALKFMRPGQQLVHTKYFTSRVTGSPATQKRQTTYIDALQSLPGLAIFFGKYQSNQRVCRSCGNVELVPSEKMTDVNIAVELMTDAFEDRFDTAILVSADSDLSAPIHAIRRLFPAKRLVVAFPPARRSAELATIASANLQIGRGVIANSQLPPQITVAGVTLTCPPSWT